jgi:hypothetical protein
MRKLRAFGFRLLGLFRGRLSDDDFAASVRNERTLRCWC